MERSLKDAYQVLYTLGKLSTRAVPMPEGTMDLRSQGMRSKLLALHLILTILSSHSYVFLAPCGNIFNQTSSAESNIFIDYAKEHLCLAVSRNAISVVPPVLEVAIDIFGKLLVHLWPFLKKEIGVIFTEIVLPLIEAKKQFSFFQRIAMIKGLNRILSDPKIDGGKVLVELYLNYDCDAESGVRENIWEHLASALSKTISQHGDPGTNHSYSQISPFAHFSGARDLTPEMTTSNLTTFTKEQVKDLYSLTGNVEEFRKCGTDLIVNGILKPLSTYCQNRIKVQTPLEIDSKSIVVNSTEAIYEDEKKTASDCGDDPTAFEEFKHRKKAIIEGIKLFNQKPKKV
jgi:brefeldin A-inhibited guanine nucleotide-exchange protein